MSTAVKNLGQIKSITDLPGRATRVEVFTSVSAAQVARESKDRFLVPPINAIATDAIGLAVAQIAFWVSDNVILKILAGGASLWMTTALVSKIVSLTEPPKGTVFLNPEIKEEAA